VTVFGSQYASAYDRVYADKDYERECDLIEELFTRYSRDPVRSILDLGCGTGNHALPLARRGYRVVGVDRSDEMLSRARAKADASGIDILFENVDIRSLSPGDFDAVLLLFAVLGYQHSDDDVLRTLRSSRAQLDTDGLLVFDVWNGPAVIAQGPDHRVRDVASEGGTVLRRSSSGRLIDGKPLCAVDISVTELDGETVVSETKETHVMRYFFTDELDAFLEECRFKLVASGAFPSFDREPDDTTWNAIFVARAI
jgi:SAM-dependent methyltransferase